MSYEIDYKDQRFKDVEADKNNAISDLEKTYSGMIDDTEAYYQAQVNASKEWEKKQTELQNQQTDFAIKEIEQNKEEAKQDYTKEQSGAYQDWKKQSAKHGVNAEQIADRGMQNTGYAESSQVSMYNTYQNRVAVARESYNRIVVDFNNAITQARMQNNSALAEIAYKSLQQRLELNLQGFQYKNTLLQEQASRKTELEQIYHERWQDVLDQMNTENALAEEIRQFNEQMEWEKYTYEQAHAKSSGGGGGGGGYYVIRTPKKQDDTEEQIDKEPDIINYNKNQYNDAENDLNKAIAEGASKDKIANAISVAERNGVITKPQANLLRETYTPRGVQY